MTLTEIATLLQGVRYTPHGILALCPGHEDHHPSLSVREGRRGLLVKCWAECPLERIASGLGRSVTDFFYDALSSNPAERKAAAQQRERIRREQAAQAAKAGRRIDALREADSFIHSRRGLDISEWSDEHLDANLNVLADAYALLASENGNE